MPRPSQPLAVVLGAALAATLLVLTAAVLRGGGDDTGRLPTANTDAAGRPLPDLGFTYFDGSDGSFDEFAGKPLVVNFWASWCAPCVAEMPMFQKVHTSLGTSVGFLGLDARDPLADGKRMARRTGVTYPLARDPNGDLQAAVGAIVMPTTLFADADGRVVYAHNGAISESKLRRLLATHLDVR